MPVGFWVFLAAPHSVTLSPTVPYLSGPHEQAQVAPVVQGEMETEGRTPCAEAEPGGSSSLTAPCLNFLEERPSRDTQHFWLWSHVLSLPAWVRVI